MEHPLFFESHGFRLFAMAHRPEGTSPAPIGVVVCHPYGEEKQLSYPVLGRFARVLAASGFPVLRFDCRGYGDSDGDLEDATLATQVAETVAAGRLAHEVLGVERIVLLGLRLGASVAARVAEREPSTAGLVLWSPIVSGREYVDSMIRRRLFAEMLEKRKPSRERILEELARDGRLEIEGNFLSRQMTEDLAELDLATESMHYQGPVLVSTIRHRANAYEPYQAVARAYEAAGAPCTFEVGGEQPFWERNAMYEMYFPEELFAATSRWMRTHWQTS